MTVKTAVNRSINCLKLVTAAFAVLAATNGIAGEPIRLRVLSYNIHHAEGVDGKLDVDRIAQVILSANADIVALQEVDQKVTRSKDVDQPAELARLTKMNVAFGANIPLQGGHYGNAVLTRFPIIEHKNHLLPNLGNGEQRGVLVAELEISKTKQPLVLFATHLDHRRDERERVASAEAINKLAAAHDHKAMLLAGDLNAVPDSKTLSDLGREWQRTNEQPIPTIPVATPTRQIDYVLCRPAQRWKVVETEVLGEAVASDHRPIIAVLELTESSN
ncbi:endonuclease/exonuclease/phosphatase family protein [Fuerstiella marisgermanici]|uniref:Exodeoxyribonuclease III (Xth) n=1 Tax=Fuerstiella marisgermanici TaxID=1891926 RepID=A0A1P8WJK2_9PLAN|nr:endonuclease/exonuclease/phosphatase family protein [Fuerstiella marisgermanici]APZ94242.1 exodeoxyribonuclease III (xth) [Fuerstiella marisgermanici]